MASAVDEGGACVCHIWFVPPATQSNVRLRMECLLTGLLILIEWPSTTDKKRGGADELVLGRNHRKDGVR